MSTFLSLLVGGRRGTTITTIIMEHTVTVLHPRIPMRFFADCSSESNPSLYGNCASENNPPSSIIDLS